MSNSRLLPYLLCPSCQLEVAPARARPHLECTNDSCASVFTVRGKIVDFLETPAKHLRLQTWFWNLRASFYELFLPITSILGDNKFSYFHAIKQVVEAALQAAPTSDLPVLDVATGTGLVARSLAGTSKDRLVVGLDYSGEMLEVAQMQADATGIDAIQFVKADAHSLPFKDGSFRAVTCAGAISNMNDPARVLKELVRVTVKDGTVALLVTLYDKSPSWGVRFSRWTLDVTYAINQVPLKWFSESDFRGLMHGAGFRDVEVQWLGGAWTLVTGRV